MRPALEDEVGRLELLLQQERAAWPASAEKQLVRQATHALASLERFEAALAAARGLLGRQGAALAAVAKAVESCAAAEDVRQVEKVSLLERPLGAARLAAIHLREAIRAAEPFWAAAQASAIRCSHACVIVLRRDMAETLGTRLRQLRDQLAQVVRARRGGPGEEEAKALSVLRAMEARAGGRLAVPEIHWPADDARDPFAPPELVEPGEHERLGPGRGP